MNDELKTQLTAWALGELPPDEQAATEARLDDLPEAKAYAQDTREFCSLLTNALAPATESTLTPDQRAELARQFGTPRAEKVVRFRSATLAWVAGLGAVAAALVLWSGQFLGPASPSVAVLPASHTPEVARRAGTPDRSAADWDTPTDDYSKLSEKADDRLLGLFRQEVAKDGETAATGTGLLAEDESVRFGDSTREPSKYFGLNPDPAGTQPVEAQGVDQNSTSGRAARLGRSELISEGLDVKSKVTVAENRARGPLAPTTPPASAQTGPSPTPAAAAPEDSFLLSSLDDGTAKEAPAPAGATLDSRSTAERMLALAAPKGEAQSGVTTNFDSGVALSVAEAKLTDLTAAAGPAENKPQTAELSKGFGGVTARGATAAPEISVGGLPGIGPTPAKPEAVPAGFEGAGLGGGRGLATRTATPTSWEEARLYKERLDQETESRHRWQSFRYAIPTPPESTAESYAAVPENPFKAVATEPLSTFSIDVDTAAYANVRRFLNQGQRPPQPAVRIEEMVNYFRYDYPQPEAGKPFSVIVDLADCPWQPQHRLARVGLKGRDVAADKRPQSNLVFLIDVSGSMNEPNKLPLVQQSLRLLSGQLTETDRVAMVTYAGNSGLALDSTNGADRAKIGTAIDQLAAGGSTNGASGIQLAYEVAQQHFIKEGVNRVLLATDGDFNVGVTSQEALQQLITDRAKGGVFLSVLGYGMGNLKDSTMEMLADKGNGNYAYIDSLGEARKVLSEEMSGTLVTIAKDVKIQVEFNPAVVRGYRLLGYENRMLAKEDFNDDRKDAGEIGAGHTVTALYELVPVGAPPDVPPVSGLRYTPAPIVAGAAPAEVRKPIDPAIARETMVVKLRYKAPDGDVSQLLEVPVIDKEAKFVEAPADFKFAASVTLFGMLLKDSAHKGNASWDQVRQFALEGKGPDPLGYRGEFIQLVEKARGVAP